MSFKGHQFLWKDRKRILGMPISFTKYALSEDRLFTQIGLLNLKDEEALLYRVRDISLQRTLWQRIFRVGTVTLVSSDKSTPVISLKNIKDPVRIKELIHKNVEDIKIKRHIRIGEVTTERSEPDDIEYPEDFDAENGNENN